MESNKKLYICNRCDREFDVQLALANHTRLVHPLTRSEKQFIRKTYNSLRLKASSNRQALVKTATVTNRALTTVARISIKTKPVTTPKTKPVTTSSITSPVLEGFPLKLSDFDSAVDVLEGFWMFAFAKQTSIKELQEQVSQLESERDSLIKRIAYIEKTFEKQINFKKVIAGLKSENRELQEQVKSLLSKSTNKNRFMTRFQDKLKESARGI